MLRCLAASVVALLGILHPSLADWPQLRHDAAHTGYTDEPVRPPLELKWKFVDDPNPDPTDQYPAELEPYLYRYADGSVGLGPSSATVDFPEMVASGDSLFLNRAASGTVRMHRLTGEVLWRWPRRPWMAALEADALVHVDGSTRRRSPFAVLWGEVVVCDAATGELRYRLTFGDALPGFWTGAPPTGRTAYCCVSHGLIAVTGIAPPRPGSREADSGTWLRLLDIRDGSLVTETQHLPSRGQVGPGLAFGHVSAGGLHFPCTMRAWGRQLMILAYSEGTTPGPWALSAKGAVLSMTPPDAQHNEWVGPVVLAEDQGLVFGCEHRMPPKRCLTCRDALTGRLVWSRQLISSPNCNFSPAVDDSRVYIGLTEGAVYAFDMVTGEVLWRTVVGEALPFENGLSSPGSGFQPICSACSDMLWVVYRGKLLALSKGTGEIEWETDGTDCTWYEPVIHGGWIYLMTVYGIEAWGPAPQTGGTKPAHDAANATEPDKQQ
jgi:hypothetical protein